MKRKKILFILILLVTTFIIVRLVSCNEEKYTVQIVSYTKNNSFVEYPQINGLKDKEKQASINKILKKQVFDGTKDYLNKTFVNFSNPNCIYEFKIRKGVINGDISSFLYSFFGHSENEKNKGEFGIMGYMDRNYGVTINMDSGEKIELSDFMEIDDRLINSNDGSGKKTNYDSPVNPKFHNFKDAFMVYDSQDERDSHHIVSVEETIKRLKDRRSETRWYIDENKNIVFYYDKNIVKIPYETIEDAIYPRYYNALKR